MRTPLAALFCCTALALASPAAGPPRRSAAEDALAASAPADRALLREIKVALDTPSLLAFLGKRALTGEVRDRARALIARLGSDSFEEREKASSDLPRLGPAVLPLVRAAADHPNPEVRRRARRCLKELERQLHPGAAPAAARLLALRRAPGAAEALLAYLPAAEDETADEEVRAALTALAVRGGKADPALVKALADLSPVRRGASAEALGRAGATAQLPAVRKLLKDRDPAVRMRAALGLAHAGDRGAVPVLIASLAELPAEQASPAEEALRRLAGEHAPDAPAKPDAGARRKYRDAWAAWWKKSEARADLARLARPGELGYTLVIGFDPPRVAELGRDGKPRWEIKGFNNPCDAHVLPGNRVLIADHGTRSVTERTFDGKVVWEKKLGPGSAFNDGPVLCQRLSNGHTFIVTMSGVLEVDRAGKEVFSRKESLRAARKFPDGRIALVTQGGEYVRLSPAGKEEKRFRIRVEISNAIGGIEFLPGGGLLAGQPDRVVRYDAGGKVVWEAKVDRPSCITRLGDGHALVASLGTGRVVELDRRGKGVRTLTPGGRLWLARRR